MRTTRALSNGSVARVLDRIAGLLELEGAETPKPAACRQAAETIRHDVRSLNERIDENGVAAVHGLGIGYALSALITAWVHTGDVELLRRLEERHGGQRVWRTSWRRGTDAAPAGTVPSSA